MSKLFCLSYFNLSAKRAWQFLREALLYAQLFPHPASFSTLCYAQSQPLSQVLSLFISCSSGTPFPYSSSHSALMSCHPFLLVLFHFPSSPLLFLCAFLTLTRLPPTLFITSTFFLLIYFALTL